MPSADPTVSRRRVLFGAAALALLGAGATACGSPPPPEIDDLVAQLDLARNDSQLAGAAVATAPPQLARALTAVASERSAHARALENEITRATGGAPTETSTTTSSAPPPKPPTTKDVIGALRTSAKDAGDLAARLSGYRAGLLGSIAAACTAAYTVALASPEKAP